MDPLDQAADASQAPSRPYEGPVPSQRGPEGSRQTIAPSTPLLHRQGSGDHPAAAMAQPSGMASAAVPLTAEAIVARLERHAQHAQGALAPETERALRKAAAAFTGWATAQGLGALPATPETVAGYVDAPAAQGRRPASMRQAVWAIATLHRAAGLPDPSQAEPVRLALKRMGRSLGTRQRQAAPLGDTGSG